MVCWWAIGPTFLDSQNKRNHIFAIGIIARSCELSHRSSCTSTPDCITAISIERRNATWTQCVFAHHSGRP